MGIMLDSAVPPTPAQIEAAKALYPDLVGWMGYVPGWGRPYIAPGSTGWTSEAVKVVLEAGLGFYPLLVPYSGDPASTPADIPGWQVALEMARQQVEGAGGVLAGAGLNIEAGWVATAAAQSGWRQKVTLMKEAWGEVPNGVYGPPAWLASLASLGGAAPTQILVGEWPDGAAAPSPLPTSPAVIPGIPNDDWIIPGQRAWQFQGGHSLGDTGLAVDCSVVDASFPFSRLAPPPPAPSPSPTPLEVLQATLGQLQSLVAIAIAQSKEI